MSVMIAPGVGAASETDSARMVTFDGRRLPYESLEPIMWPRNRGELKFRGIDSAHFHEHIELAAADGHVFECAYAVENVFYWGRGRFTDWSPGERGVDARWEGDMSKDGVYSWHNEPDEELEAERRAQFKQIGELAAAFKRKMERDRWMRP